MSEKFEFNKSIKPTLVDWIVESDPDEKRAACGKVTQLLVYTTDTIGILVFYCHRWDCPACSAKRIREIKEKTLGQCLTWYAKFIDNAEYGASKKRIERAGAEYCAVGTSNVWLVLSNENVLERSRVLPPQLLSRAIEVVLGQTCADRQHRFRHTIGLFPTAFTKSDVHISRKIIIAEKKEKALEKLINQGYMWRGGNKNVDFLKPPSKEAVEALFKGEIFNILWAK